MFLHGGVNKALFEQENHCIKNMDKENSARRKRREGCLKAAPTSLDELPFFVEISSLYGQSCFHLVALPSSTAISRKGQRS